MGWRRCVVCVCVFFFVNFVLCVLSAIVCVLLYGVRFVCDVLCVFLCAVV